MAPARIAPPVRRPSAIRRDRLVDRLRTSDWARAVVLSAPAGYGKTTVLLQWAAVDGRPFAWIRVSDVDDDPAVLIRHLLAAIDPIEPVEREIVATLTAAEPRFSSVVVPLLERLLRSRETPFVLVLDDVGEISSEQALRVIGLVVANLPEGSQVACATRSAPPRPLRRLRADRCLDEIGRAELAMTDEEASELLLSLGLDSRTAASRHLLERAEGWPAGLYLAARSAVEEMSQETGTAWGDVAVEEAVADYFFDEFLLGADAATVRFLLEVSILSDLDGPACDAVTGRVGTAELLHGLARSNQMVIPVAGPRDTYRFHRLFREFLATELRRRHPDRIAHLNRRASAHYVAIGDVESAIRHAHAAGDADLLGEIVWSQAPACLGSGRGDLPRSWLRGLSEREIARSAGLSLTAAWVATQAGDMVAFARWLATAEARLRESGPAAPAGLTAGVEVVRATAGGEGLAGIIARCTRAIDVAPGDSALLSLAHYLRGVAAILLGRSAAGCDDLERAELLAGASQMHTIRAHAVAGLGRVALAAGDSARWTERVAEARAIVAEHGLDYIPTLAPVFAASALSLAMQGCHEAAEGEALRALRQTSLIRGLAPWFGVLGRLQLARAFLLLHDRARARVLLDEAVALHGPATESPVLAHLLKETTDLVRRVEDVPGQGPSSLTTAELRVLQYLPSHLTLQHIAGELYVSPHTVKSQVAAVYRKLGATSRADAVHAARGLGLLPAV